MSLSASRPGVDDESLWSSLGLDAVSLSKEPAPVLSTPRAATSNAAAAAAAWGGAVDSCVASCVAHAAEAREAVKDASAANEALTAARSALLATAERLAAVEARVVSLQSSARGGAERARQGRDAHHHLSGFVHELALDPALVRHVVDGRVGDARYAQCLTELAKKRAVYGMRDVRGAKMYAELRPYLQKLLGTAVLKSRQFLLRKIELLTRPNTNVGIIKESALLPHRAVVEFLEEQDPRSFLEIREAYVDTMSKTYFTLFRKYATGLFALKAEPPVEVLDLLVANSTATAAASVREAAGAFVRQASLGSLFAKTDSNPASANEEAAANEPDFSMENRVEVLRDVTGPAIVLAVAQDNKTRFPYEVIHRSIGKMLSETAASEHLFCDQFFGESDGRMFNVFFKRVVTNLLETISTHVASSRDTIGILLAFKINEAQRTSMQNRNVMDLSDFFIKVDILLKPKFKKLLDENVASLTLAAQNFAKTTERGERDVAVHPVTRRYVEFSAAVLTIAGFGTRDDSITDGLRRLRAEYGAFLNSLSALFPRAKHRYMFLISNVDLILSVYHRNGLSHTDEYRSYSELHGVHTAAFVEHEVADHFPDLVSFVREYERLVKSGVPSPRKRFAPETRVKAVLREFAANWRLSVEHMLENIAREFQSLTVGSDVSRALFARLLAYHKRCESAIDAKYPALRNELVTSTEIVHELRQKRVGAS